MGAQGNKRDDGLFGGCLIALIIGGILFALAILEMRKVREMGSGSPTNESYVPSDDRFDYPEPNRFEAIHYGKFWITQYEHGKTRATDVSAGKRQPIYSPINGRVITIGHDDDDNSFLTIENQEYYVRLYHGEYDKTGQGDDLQIGEPVGVEWNHGETVDRHGKSCRDRDCGYHTHIIIWDKRDEGWVNYLKLI